MKSQIDEKERELATKRKENASQLIEINTLRKKKEKEGTLKINENLTKKTKKLEKEKGELRKEIEKLKKDVTDGGSKEQKKRIETKEAEIKSLQKTVKRIRNERDDVKDKLKKNEAVHDAAIRNLKAELDRLEKRFQAMVISVKKEGDATTDLATTNDDTIDDEIQPEKSKHNMSATDSESSSLYDDEVQPKKRKSSESFGEDSAGQPFKKKKSDILPKFNQEKEFLDDSFNNLIPVSNEVIGRNVVKNYECKKDVITPPTEAIQYSNKNCVVTTLNEKISFLAVGEKARQKHNFDMYGNKPCGLSPVCSNIFRGGEDIGYAFICPPTNAFHKYFQRRTWVCWYHTQASLDGHDVQVQRVHVVTETPQNQKPKDVPQNAPTKAAADTNTIKSGKMTKVNLAEKLNAESSDEDFKEEEEHNSEDLKTDEDSISGDAM